MILFSFIQSELRFVLHAEGTFFFLLCINDNPGLFNIYASISSSRTILSPHALSCNHDLSFFYVLISIKGKKRTQDSRVLI